MGSVIVILECPTWEWHYNLALDSLLLMARATLKVDIFFYCSFGLSVISRHFSPQDTSVHRTRMTSSTCMRHTLSTCLCYTYLLWVRCFHGHSSFHRDYPSEAICLHIIRLDSEASSTMGSKVEGHGGRG